MSLHETPVYVEDVWEEPGKRGSVEYSVAALPNHTLRVTLKAVQKKEAQNFKFSFQVLFLGEKNKRPLSDRKRIFDSKNALASWSRYYSVYLCELCEDATVSIHAVND